VETRSCAHYQLNFSALKENLVRLTIITWLYNNTGRSVFIAVLFHAMFNLTWQLFPIDGSFYDPRVTSLILAAVAIAVVIASGPGTLIRTRNTREVIR
jgi:hypothetical protein